MQRRGSSQGGRWSRGKHRAGVGVQLGTWGPAFGSGRAHWGPGRNISVDRPSGCLGRSWSIRKAGLDATAEEEPWQILKEGDNMMQMSSTI